MKVINTLIVALALAVPHALVTADELVIKNNNIFNTGNEDYSPDMHEALKISPIGYEHVVVVPPGHDKPVVAELETVKTGTRLQNVNLPITGEIVTRVEVRTP